MSGAHLHLLVNHLPIVGAFLAIPLLGLAVLLRRDRGMLRASVVVLVLSASGAGIALGTGEPAEEQVEDLPGISAPAIHTHEERAEAAAGLSVLAAVVGAGALLLAERRGQAPPLPLAAAVAAALLSAGAMAWTGASGGVIHHEELRGAPAAGGGAVAQRGDGESGEEDD